MYLGGSVKARKCFKALIPGGRRKPQEGKQERVCFCIGGWCRSWYRNWIRIWISVNPLDDQREADQ